MPGGSGPWTMMAAMYGLINIAIRDLVTNQFGQEQWESILAKAQVGDEHLLRMMYPDLNPPEFSCEDITDENLVLHYRSDRPGLDDLLIGLLRGLGKRFKVAVDVKQLASKDDGADSSKFHVS